MMVSQEVKQSKTGGPSAAAAAAASKAARAAAVARGLGMWGSGRFAVGVEGGEGSGEEMLAKWAASVLLDWRVRGEQKRDIAPTQNHLQKISYLRQESCREDHPELIMHISCAHSRQRKSASLKLN